MGLPRPQLGHPTRRRVRTTGIRGQGEDFTSSGATRRCSSTTTRCCSSPRRTATATTSSRWRCGSGTTGARNDSGSRSPRSPTSQAPGPRARCVWSLTEPDGTPLAVTVAREYPCYLLKGTGYGADDDWRHGAWQGDLVTQRLAWDLEDPEVRAGLFGLVENVASAVEHRSEGDESGWGMLEFACFGAHDRSGFDGWENLNLVPLDQEG